MRQSTLGRILSLLCIVILGIARVGYAGNALEIIQAVDSPCDLYGGGNSIAVSPDGLHAYEAFDLQITASTRSAVTGELTPFQTLTDATFVNVFNIAVSPDGEHVYLGSPTHGIAVLDRNTSSGALAVVTTGTPPPTSNVAGGIGLSPDGLHLYAGGDALTTYARNTSTGLLTQIAQDTTIAVRDVVVSPDGAHVYVSRLVSPAEIRVYGRDGGTGMLTSLGTTSTPLGSGELAVSADGANVYIASRGSDVSGGVVAFARNAGTGLLTVVDSEDMSDLPILAGALDVALSADGQNLYLSVFTASLSDNDGVVVFERSGVDGSLTLIEQQLDQVGPVDGLDETLDLTVSPDGAHVYAIGEGTVTFDRDGTTGTLTFVQNEESERAGAGVAVSPDGNHAYRLCRRAVATFDRDGTSGTLTQSGNLTLGTNVDDAYDLVIAPDGAHVYVLNIFGSSGGRIVVLERNPVGGALTVVTEHTGTALGGQIGAIAISTDGENVYLIGGNSGSPPFVVLTRDPITGLLTPLQTLFGGSGGVPPGALEAVWDVTVSPDGAHVYVASYDVFDGTEDGIAAFARDPGTGALTFASMLTVNGGGGGSLEGVRQLTVSPDGSLLYATGIFNVQSASGVSVYARDALTGALTFKSSLREGTPNAETLGVATGLDVHPAGTQLYAAGGTAVHVLRTDTATGAPGFAQSVPVALPFFTTFEGALATSSNGEQLYASVSDGTIRVLAPRVVCSATPAPGCGAADTAALKVIEKVGSGDLVSWKWKAPAALAIGDPLTTTEFAVCLYDASASDQPIMSAVVASGGTCGTKPCWSVNTAGHKYVDKVGSPDGVTKIRLLTSSSGTSKIVLKGKGASLPPLGLPYATPVTVQLQASNGECWEASYAIPTITSGAMFKATD